jgi:hypothetical protein
MISKIIYGRKSSDFDTVIEPLARAALCLTYRSGKGCDCYSCSLSLNSHPDYKILDKDAYSVDDIDTVCAYAQSDPMIGKNRVVVLKNLPKVTDVSQNKLLKELEDNPNFVMIATAETSGGDGMILPTIKSRTAAVTSLARTGDIEDFRNFFGDEAELLYRMSGKDIGLAEDMQEQTHIYGALEKAFKNRDRRMIFETLNLVKNKDTASYFLKYRDYVPVLFRFLADTALDCGAYSQQEALAVLRIANTEAAYSYGSSYDAGQFFTGIVKIAEKIKKENERHENK